MRLIDPAETDFDLICSRFQWSIPERLNVAYQVCERHQGQAQQIAIYYENAAGKRASYRFGDLKKLSDRFANALRGLGVERGDRVAIVLPQTIETVIAHLAIHKLGAVSLPLAILTHGAVNRAIELLAGNGTIETFSVLPRLLRDNVVFENWEGSHHTLRMQVLRDAQRLGLHEGLFATLEERLGRDTLLRDREAFDRGLARLRSQRQSLSREVRELQEQRAELTEAMREGAVRVKASKSLPFKQGQVAREVASGSRRSIPVEQSMSSFEITDELADGLFARIRMARHRQSGRACVIKELKQDFVLPRLPNGHLYIDIFDHSKVCCVNAEPSIAAGCLLPLGDKPGE